MQKSKFMKLLVALMAMAMVATACGGGGDDSSSSDSSSASEATETSSDSSSASEAAEAAEEEEEAEESSSSSEAAEEEAEEEEAAPIVENQEESVLEPVFGGTLRWGIQAESDGINPTASALSASGLAMMNAVFDTLAFFDVDGNWVPHLAESFTPSADCKTWTMKLREGITFHDGTALNTAAVSVNFLAQFSDPLVGLAVRPYYASTEEAITLVDDLTMTYNLSDSNCNFPTSLTGQLGAVGSPTWLAAALEDPTLDQQPVGTGPFVFDSRTQDSVTKFVKNQNYWGGNVYLDAVEFYPITDPDVRTRLLLEGELDGMASTNAESIAQLAELDAVQVLDDTGDESFLMLNSASAPFDDIRARQAITHATPRDNYNTLINLDVTRKADQMFTPESPYYNPDVVQLSDRPELAGPLVADYCEDNPGNCDGGKINIEYQYSGPSVVGERIADLLVEGWSDFFNVTVQVLPQDAHIQEAAFGIYDSIGWRQFGAVNPGDDRVWLLCRAVGGISLNWPRFCDESRDTIILEADALTDAADKAPLYQELSQKINDDYLYVFYHHTLWSLALADDVQNLCEATSLEGIQFRCQVNGRNLFQSTFLSD